MRITSLLAAALALLSPCAQAQTYPSKPVRIIIPFPPGEGPDVILRRASEALQQSTGQPWLAENRTGGSGPVGADAGAKAPPDGYSVLFSTSGTSALGIKAE